jgi:prevent-host-death family protein
MTEKISSTEVRRRIGDLLDRVTLRHEEFIIERKGKSLAALIPVERLEQMRRLARRHALDFLDQQAGGALSDEQAADLGLEAQRWAREEGASPRRRTR